LFCAKLQNNLFELTGGPNGLYGIDHLRIFGLEIKNQNSIYLISLLVPDFDTMGFA